MEDGGWMIEDQGSRIEDRGWMTEDRGWRMGMEHLPTVRLRFSDLQIFQ